jgi:hypothetical protein
MNKHILIATALLTFIAGCATIENVPYAAQPARITDPREEVRTIILANTVQGCTAEPELSEKMLIVKFACAAKGNTGLGNSVVRFDKVDSITMQQSGEWYRVLLHHKPGVEDFTWGSKNREDIERLVDALTALSSTNTATPETAPATEAAAAAESAG